MKSTELSKLCKSKGVKTARSKAEKIFNLENNVMAKPRAPSPKDVGYEMGMEKVEITEGDKGLEEEPKGPGPYEDVEEVEIAEDDKEPEEIEEPEDPEEPKPEEVEITEDDQGPERETYIYEKLPENETPKEELERLDEEEEAVREWLRQIKERRANVKNFLKGGC